MEYVRQRVGVSERQACRMLGQARSTTPLKLGLLGGSTNRRILRRWHSTSNAAKNLESRSAWKARTGKDMRACTVSRNCTARPAVARRWASRLSQGETTSRPVNCFEDDPGQGPKIERVELDQVAQPPGVILVRFAHGMRAAGSAFGGLEGSAPRLDQSSMPFEVCQDASPCRR